jgi:two-component system, OmpR family, sensor histidine kinase SenX3
VSSWLVVLLCAIACGIGLAVGRYSKRDPVPDEPELPPVPPDALIVAIESGAAALFVGNQDDVLDATEPARAMGLARGNRVASPRTLELVRSVRRTGLADHATIERPGSTTAAPANLAVSVAPLRDGVVVVLARDISEERRIDLSRRDFVTNISHELKTPIGAIALLSEAVEQASDDPEMVVRFATRMQRESARLTELVQQIITLSRLQSDDPLREAKAVDISAVVRRAVDRLGSAARARRVALTVSDREPGDVIGDGAQLIDAVANLVANAIAYSHEGARVTVTCGRRRIGDDEVIEIAVTDNGIGIAEADQERIFDRFYRVDPDRSRASGGTGLGLSIVKLVTEAHGGNVSLWSKVGSGSTFTIRLPAWIPPVQPEASNTDQEVAS